MTNPPGSKWYAVSAHHAILWAIVAAGLITLAGGLPGLIGALLLAAVPALRLPRADRGRSLGLIYATFLMAIGGGLAGDVVGGAGHLGVRLVLGLIAGVIVGATLVVGGMFRALLNRTRPGSA